MRWPAADHPKRRGRAMRADSIMFTPTFWKSRSSFISSLLLFNCDPLALGSHLRCVGLQWTTRSSAAGRCERTAYRSLRLFGKAGAHSFRRSSFSAVTRFAGLTSEMRRPAADHPEQRGRAMRADSISFAPTFWQSRSSFISSLLLFSCDPLALGSHLRCGGCSGSSGAARQGDASGLHIVCSDFLAKPELIHFVAPPFQL